MDIENELNHNLIAMLLRIMDHGSNHQAQNASIFCLMACLSLCSIVTVVPHSTYRCRLSFDITSLLIVRGSMCSNAVMQEHQIRFEENPHKTTI